MSSNYNVYLKAPDYLAEWITDTFGNPVQLIKDSPEMRLLNELTVKRPCDEQPDTGEGANVIIPIPYFKGKDPAVYNHLYKTGKDAMIESFTTLFDKNLWTEITDLKNGRVKKKTLIFVFMENHGINERHWDTISQRLHRLHVKYRNRNKLKIR